MDIQKILDLLPHRYPFLLVDRVLEFKPGKSITAIKNVTVNEPFFQGHFPGHPVMPGVLILEALAQTSGIYEFASREASHQSTNFLFLLVSIDKARFRKQVIPGDQILLQVDLVSKRRNMMKVKGTAMVDGDVVASAEIMCAQQELDS
jgi:3-hydroxyacyl-[acyl-carrier-protein] dehydratase